MLSAEVLKDAGSHGSIIFVGREGLSPGVETEVDSDPPALAVGKDDWPGVSQPGVIDREFENLDIRGRHAGPCIGCLGGINYKQHRFELGDCRDYFGVRVASGLDRRSAPGVFPLRPGDESQLMRVPLGGHRDPILPICRFPGQSRMVHAAMLPAPERIPETRDSKIRVEPRGIEPLTSAMPWRRSSS